VLLAPRGKGHQRSGAVFGGRARVIARGDSRGLELQQRLQGRPRWVW